MTRMYITHIYIYTAHTSADLCISNVEQMKSFFKLSLCSRKQTRHGVLIRLSLFQGWLFEPLFYYKRGVSRDGVVLCRVVLWCDVLCCDVLWIVCCVWCVVCGLWCVVCFVYCVYVCICVSMHTFFSCKATAESATRSHKGACSCTQVSMHTCIHVYLCMYVQDIDCFSAKLRSMHYFKVTV